MKRLVTALLPETEKVAIFSVGSVYVLKVIGAFLGLISTVLLARVLGPNEYGEYAYIIAWLSVLALLSSFGLPQIVLREIASTFETENANSGLQVFKNSRTLVISVSLLFAVMTALAGKFSNTLENDMAIAVLFGILTLPLLTLLYIEQAAIRGAHQAVRSFVPEAFLRPSVFLLLISICILMKFNLTSQLVLLFYLLAVLIALFYAVFQRRVFLPKFHEQHIQQELRLSEYLSLIKQGIPFLFIGGMNTIMLGFATIFIGALHGTKSAGIFNIAASIIMIMPFIQIAVNAVYLPKMAKYAKASQYIPLKTCVNDATRYLLIISLPLTLIFVLAGEHILLVFGPAYAEGAYVLAMLAVGQLIIVSAGGMLGALNMSGYERELARLLLFTITFSIFIGIVLIPKLGIYGAAGSIFIGNCIWGIVIIIQWKNIINKLKYKMKTEQHSI